MGKVKGAENVDDQAARLGREMGAPAGRVTRQSIRTWKSKDYPLDDSAELKRRLASQPQPPDWMIDQVGDVPAEEVRARTNIAKMLKVEAEATLKENEVKKQDGELLPRARVAHLFQCFGALDRSAWLKLQNHLPPILAGLSETQVLAKLRPYLAREMAELSRAATDLGMDEFLTGERLVEWCERERARLGELIELETQQE
jgi:hypothetical protein